jgi:hypothetical protein
VTPTGARSGSTRSPRRSTWSASCSPRTMRWRSTRPRR